MSSTKTKTRTARASKKKRAVREKQTVYTTHNANGKRALRPARAKKLVIEMYGGEPYEYYPLGKYVVAAPGVCGGRPTFKYTRVEVKPILDAMGDGWSVNDVVNFYQRPEISSVAVREAVRLASTAFAQSVSARMLVA